MVLEGRCPAEFRSKPQLDTPEPANQAFIRQNSNFSVAVLRQVGVKRFHDSTLKHGQGGQTEFTIDFTFYKVLILMLCL